MAPLTRRDWLKSAGTCGLILAGIASWSTCAGADDKTTMINIGSDRQLFVDRVLIDEMDGTTLRLHHPVRREKVFTFDKPWEGELSWYPVVIRDGGKYRMWYRAWGNAITQGQEPWKSRYTCYAESPDGIHWQRPSLGIHEFDGSKENNLVFTDPQFANVCVLKDDNPATPKEELYKAVARSSAAKPGKIYGAVSEDGVHWKRLDKPLFVERPDGDFFDGAPIVYWDSHQQRYMCYFRGHRPPDANRKVLRSIKVSASRDFRNWQPVKYIDIGQPWREQFYTNGAQMYYRAPLYLLFPKRIVFGRKFDTQWKHDGLSDIIFLASRDGRRFTRLFHEAFIRPGLDQNNWHERALIVGPSWIPTARGEMSTYIVENYRTKDVHVRRMTLREDGFVSVNAPLSGGAFVTKPFIFEGSQLEINFSTSAAGSVQLELTGAAGEPIPGFTLADCPQIYGDEIARRVSWKGDAKISNLARGPVRLHVMLKDADLYSFRFSGESEP